MFDIGFLELLIVSIVALLVLGPERLPQAVKTTTLWIGRIRQFARNAKQELDREIGMDEVRHQLLNEQIMRETQGIDTTILQKEADKRALENARLQQKADEEHVEGAADNAFSDKPSQPQPTETFVGAENKHER